MVEDTNELTEDQKAIHQYVKKYKNLTYLIKQGADDESYIVYVTYEMKIRKIKTLAPGMTSYYVMKKGIHSVSIIIKNMIRMRSQMQKRKPE